jgi:hypothetical protein
MERLATAPAIQGSEGLDESTVHEADKTSELACILYVAESRDTRTADDKLVMMNLLQRT